MGNLQTETKKAIKAISIETRVLIGTALIILGVIFHNYRFESAQSQ